MSKTATMTRHRPASGTRGALEEIRAGLDQAARRHGLAVITESERRRHDHILRSLKRAKRLVDAFNVAFFGESERSIKQVILDLGEYTYQANGIRESRITMLLKELDERRKAERTRRRNHEALDQNGQMVEMATATFQPDAAYEALALVDGGQSNRVESIMDERGGER